MCPSRRFARALTNFDARFRVVAGRYSFDVELFHLLLHAGLSRRFDGRACPWSLDCHNCDKSVLSGADLLYWRRKREQWRQPAEGAPDDADYLHRYFDPTARAIDGLENALAGLGLLDQALAVDLRKPQDYFHRIWSTAFRATDLANTAHRENTEHETDLRG